MQPADHHHPIIHIVTDIGVVISKLARVYTIITCRLNHQCAGIIYIAPANINYNGRGKLFDFIADSAEGKQVVRPVSDILTMPVPC